MGVRSYLRRVNLNFTENKKYSAFLFPPEKRDSLRLKGTLIVSFVNITELKKKLILIVMKLFFL